MNLRVFRRNQDNIILFWDLDILSEEQKKSSKIFIKQDGEEKELSFRFAESTKEFNTNQNVAIAIINQEENNISPNASILLKVVLGDTYKKESFLRVSPKDVLPNLERDNKKQHIQLYGWVREKRKWAKVPLIQTKDGIWAIPVVMVKNE